MLCSLFMADGFSCSLDVLYDGLAISKLQFLIKKIFFFQLYFFCENNNYPKKEQQQRNRMMRQKERVNAVNSKWIAKNDDEFDDE
jgi:hypothetical protein